MYQHRHMCTSVLSYYMYTYIVYLYICFYSRVPAICPCKHIYFEAALFVGVCVCVKRLIAFIYMSTHNYNKVHICMVVSINFCCYCCWGCVVLKLLVMLCFLWYFIANVYWISFNFISIIYRFASKHAYLIMP